MMNTKLKERVNLPNALLSLSSFYDKISVSNAEFELPLSEKSICGAVCAPCLQHRAYINLVSELGITNALYMQFRI